MSLKYKTVECGCPLGDRFEAGCLLETTEIKIWAPPDRTSGNQSRVMGEN